MRLRLHGKIGLLSFHSQRYALGAEAEIIRFSADDFQIFQQCGGVLRLRADDIKGFLFHIKCFLSCSNLEVKDALRPDLFGKHCV